ncbi:MAG: alcohol acetyltransferase, partial [Oscillospiraceae bacterium]|nr:alcohol acetyltransferase [Oscillospiraceae bacterium]
YKNRIALEVFHVLADGTGGLSFLKTLVAEYLRLAKGAVIPRDEEILDCSQTPSPEEYADGFAGAAGEIGMSRAETSAYFIKGTDEPDGFIHITTGKMPVEEILKRAKEKGVSLTEYIAAVLIDAAAKLQYRERAGRRGSFKPVKVNVPVNLRRFFGVKTKRNFSNYVNPGIDPNYGHYSFDEILSEVHYFMGLEVTKKKMAARIATNVKTERNPFLRVTPLILKNALMKLVYEFVGDRLSTTSLSNLGDMRLPAEMARHVTRMDLILGPLARNRVICAASSYKGTLYLNFTRTIQESDFERLFFTKLVELGVPVTIESNQRETV